MVKHRNFTLKYIPTTEQPGDFLTKALHYPAFNRCSVAIDQVRLADVSDIYSPNGAAVWAGGSSVNAGGECQRELCWPRRRLGGADLVIGCARGAADLQQWASCSTGLVNLHGGHPKGAEFRRSTWEIDLRRALT
ncbi:unnamed protein product [Closterium sp. NIES-53]